MKRYPSTVLFPIVPSVWPFRRTLPVVLTVGCLLLVSVAALAQGSDTLSGDVIFDVPNPFAENLENQGIRQEFGAQGDFRINYGEEDAAETINEPAALVGGLLSERVYIEADINAEGSAGAGTAQQLPEIQQESLIRSMSAAKDRVLNHRCSFGSTLERCMQIKALMPGFKDGGWMVRIAGDGNYMVERVLLLNGTLPLHYSWRVDHDGDVTPTTIRAELITEGQF